MSASKKIKYNDFVNELKAGKKFPVYFFTREESLLKDKAFSVLRKVFVSKDKEDFNYFVFYGEETEANTILEELDNPPIQNDKKLIVVRNFQNMHFQHRKKIVEYTKNPHPDNVLVIETGKVDLRKKLYSTLAKNTHVVYFYHAYNEKEAAAFINSEIKKVNKLIKPSTVSLLVEYVGLELLRLNNELQKLFLFTQGKKEITREDVEKCVGVIKDNNIFELREALARRDLQRSLKIMENLLENGEKEVGIVIMVTRFFKTLWKINYLLNQRKKSRAEIERNLPYYNSKTYVRLAAQYNDDEFPKIFAVLLDIDKKIKSLSINRSVIMTLMVYNICNLNV